MDRTLTERERIILQRVAESREAVRQGLCATAETVCAIYARVREPRPYIKAGLALGSGLAGVLIGKRLMHALVGRRGGATLPGPTVGGGAKQALWWLFVQLLSAFLLPWVRERLQGPVLTDSLKRMHPSHLFFRWLGLEK